LSWFDRLRQGLSRTRGAIIPGAASGPEEQTQALPAAAVPAAAAPAAPAAPVAAAPIAPTAPAPVGRHPAPAPQGRRHGANWEMDWDDLELALIASDAGAKLAAEIVAEARKERERGVSFREALEKALLDQLEPDQMRQKLRRVQARRNP